MVRFDEHKEDNEKIKDLFNHFHPQVTQQMSKEELEEKLKDLPEPEKRKVITDLIANSFLTSYSKKDLIDGFKKFNNSLSLIPPPNQLHLYKLIPQEGRSQYLNDCIERFIEEGVIEDDENQKRYVKGRLLTGIAMAQGVYA